MKEKVELGDLIRARLGVNMKVGDKLLDIRSQANSIAKMARDRLVEDGEFAKVYAESIAEWLEQIATQANHAVALLIENQKENT